MTIRRGVVVVAACGLSCSCTDLSAPHATPPAASAPTAADFRAAIAGVDKYQPDSPATIAARLDYADFLLEDAPGPCRDRLDMAQLEVDGVNANPVTRVVFPDGWERPADLEYRLYQARAACDTDPSAHAHDLQAALAAAQRAVQRYRSSLDYRSMAVMQDNVAVTYQALGDGAAALDAL